MIEQAIADWESLNKYADWYRDYVTRPALVARGEPAMPMKKYLVVGDEETSPLVVIQQHGVAARDCLMSRSDSEEDKAAALRDYPSSLHGELKVLRPLGGTGGRKAGVDPAEPGSDRTVKAGVKVDDEGSTEIVEAPWDNPPLPAPAEPTEHREQKPRGKDRR